MVELEFDQLVLRCCRQIIMQTMDHVRGAMRGQNRLHLKQAVADPRLQKSSQNPTKAVDRDAEDLILDALQFKFPKLPGVTAYTMFSEPLGIKTFPEGASEGNADLVAFVDPIDGTESIEALQGGCPPSTRALLAPTMNASSRTIRLMVSPTFSDSKAKRDIPQDKAFPRLQQHCLAIGLRRGVPGEAGEDNFLPGP